MKKQIISLIPIFFIIFFCQAFAQNNSDSSEEITKLFRNQKTLDIKLSYLNKDIKKKTNDSTYLKTELSYLTSKGNWKHLEVNLRGRGNFRRDNCYFPPIKMKIKKSARKGSIFKDNKELKLVVPCSYNRENNDYIVKEIMAYRLYEIVSPYHYKTRLLNIHFEENKGKKIKEYALNGIFIEDIKKVAKRHGAEVVKIDIHPLNQEDVTSVRNAFFQYMIGNVDFSTASLHNIKLIFVDNHSLPVPYDFDMSGLVDANYAIVGATNNVQLPIESVTERLYRGFKRNPQIMQQVRKEYLGRQSESMSVVDQLESEFTDPQSFITAKKFILDFFTILSNDSMFKTEIMDKMRTK